MGIFDWLFGKRKKEDFGNVMKEIKKFDSKNKKTTSKKVKKKFSNIYFINQDPEPSNFIDNLNNITDMLDDTNESDEQNKVRNILDDTIEYDEKKDVTDDGSYFKKKMEYRDKMWGDEEDDNV